MHTHVRQPSVAGKFSSVRREESRGLSNDKTRNDDGWENKPLSHDADVTCQCQNMLMSLEGVDTSYAFRDKALVF